MDPIKPLAVYIKTQEQCQSFVVDASNPITMVEMVQMGVMHAVAMGVIQDAYHNWKFIPKAEQN